MKKSAPAVLVAMLGLCTAARSAEPLSEVSFAAAIERAIEGNRLVQAEAMLDRPDMPLADLDRRRLEASLLLAGHHDSEAFARFEALSAAQPGDCRFQSGAGVAAMRLGRLKEAEPRLRAATAACGGDIAAWGALAVLEDKAGRWQQSSAAYARAIAMSADDPALLNNAGVSMMSQRRFDEAIRLFKRALLLDPANLRAKNNMDIAQVARGERPSFDLEEDSRRRAERLNNAGYAALLAGDDAAATRYFAEAIKTNPFRFDTAEANLEGASQGAQAAP